MYITSEPKNDVYRRLIDLAFDLCDEFTLVIRKEIKLNDKGKSILEKLNDHLIEMKKQSEWPGTILGCGRLAYVYHYHTSPEAREIIKEVSNSLYGWVQCDFPEDLSFYKSGKPWLVNTAHERDSYILSEDESEIDRVTNIKGLKLRKASREFETLSDWY
ncbi:stage III sporulation protein AH [Methanosarcina sp. MSH10X1]|nr:stage III sporulation protein AH [Methanosarcina sp. MSH10X1]